jgi:diguanylate cyclase (GGDEF)-like protein/PAS domain S-box-containing protein
MKRAGMTMARQQKTRSELDELTMLRAMVASLPDLLYVKDVDSRFVLANQAAATAMGVSSPAELIGKTDFDFYPREVAEAFHGDEQKIIRTGQPLVSRDELIREPDGRKRWILTTKVPLVEEDGEVTGIIGIGRNITALKELESELRQAQQDLEFKAAHDSLTGLLNRGAALEALERELARSRRGNRCMAVLLGDLDHFKLINDVHGHPVGDQVLCEAARRLQRAVRTYDSVGRCGGEEFLVILADCSPEDALNRAEQLRAAIAAHPIETAHGPLRMTISFGVLAARRASELSLQDTLREVDIALYRAKTSGRNCCCLA